jgi:hypothetical protein
MMTAAKKPGAGKYPQEEIETCSPEDYGDLIFTLYDRQDRITQYLTKKIRKLDQRITVLEERGRSP